MAQSATIADVTKAVTTEGDDYRPLATKYAEGQVI